MKEAKEAAAAFEEEHGEKPTVPQLASIMESFKNYKRPGAGLSDWMARNNITHEEIGAIKRSDRSKEKFFKFTGIEEMPRVPIVMIKKGCALAHRCRQRLVE